MKEWNSRKGRKGGGCLNVSTNTRTHRLLRKAPFALSLGLWEKLGTQALPQHPAQSCWNALLDCLPSTWPSCSAPQPSTLQSALPSEQSVRTRTAHPTREDTQPIPFPYSGSCCAGRADLSTLRTAPLPPASCWCHQKCPGCSEASSLTERLKWGKQEASDTTAVVTY